jgi:hypothetical protein
MKMWRGFSFEQQKVGLRPSRCPSTEAPWECLMATKKFSD